MYPKAPAPRRKPSQAFWRPGVPRRRGSPKRVARLGREGPEPEPPEKAEPRSSVFNVPGLALGVGELPGGARLFKPFSGLGAPMQNPMATRRVKTLDPQGRGPVRKRPRHPAAEG